MIWSPLFFGSLMITQNYRTKQVPSSGQFVDIIAALHRAVRNHSIF